MASKQHAASRRTRPGNGSLNNGDGNEKQIGKNSGSSATRPVVIKAGPKVKEPGSQPMTSAQKHLSRSGMNKLYK
jgi:hypothetical protein